MRRRDFIGLALGASAAWPIAVRAQPERVRTVGILLGSTDNPEMRRLLDGFTQSVRELGWLEGHNVRYDIHWSGGEPGNNTREARELVHGKPDIIFAAPSNVVIALQKETYRTQSHKGLSTT